MELKVSASVGLEGRCSTLPAQTRDNCSGSHSRYIGPSSMKKFLVQNSSRERFKKPFLLLSAGVAQR